MISRLRILQILLCLLGASTLLLATELPTTVQFDLVFPKENATYKPLYPFPIVFALHNGSAASRFPIHWEWELVAYSPENEWPYNVLAGAGSKSEGSPPLEETLIIAPVSELINSTVKDFILRYRFGIHYTCNDSGYVPPNQDFDVFFSSGILFSLDSENGQVPDIEAVGQCATPLGSFGIEKEVPKMFPTRNNETCAVLKPGPQPTQNCAFPINATVASQVAARMLNETACKGQSWPNVTGLVGKCRRETSGYEKPWAGAAILTSAIAVAVVLFLV
jgi:hypothetical protein